MTKLSTLEGGRMQGKYEVALWVLYAIAAISGGSGGCMVAAHRLMHGKNITAILAMAYTFAGGVFGIAGVIGLGVFSAWSLTLETVVLAGLGFGFIGAIALAGMNLSARLVMRKFGIEVDVEIRRIKPSDDGAR